jgi:SAM-dependent methyltransferase
MMTPFNWSGLYGSRQSVLREFPSIWRLPVVKKELDRLVPNVKSGASVLEIGAGDRRFRDKLRSIVGDFDYKSMDIDTDTEQDYYSVADIEGKYDLIYMFELIEHLSVEDGFGLLRKCAGLLKPGGRILIGTPNLYHPHRYFGDVTHVTPYKYEELGALMSMSGFRPTGFYRVYNDAFISRIIKLTLGSVIHKYLDIDFAPNILAEATLN